MTPPPEPEFADLAALEAMLAQMADIPGEAPGLSELDHALQCADALKLSAPDDLELQIAGLVHDIGHAHGANHDRVGGEAVRPILGDRVAALVALHVDAKRYLVATDAAYRERLSPVSIHTLELQGGPMSEAEAAAFAALPYARDAITLRHADEAAKVVGLKTASLDSWLPGLRQIAAAR